MHRPLRKEIVQTLSLAVPLVFAQMAQMSMTFVDTIMLGRLGSRELAAAALGGIVFFPLAFVCLGILAAVSPLVSQAFGAGDEHTLGRSVRQGLWLATVLGLPAAGLLWLAPALLTGLGQDPTLVELTRPYLRALSVGFLPLLWFGTLRNFVEGVSRPRVVVAIMVCGVLLNVSANWVLMYGKFGFPALRVTGCGIATALVYWTMCGLMILLNRSTPDLHQYGVFSRLGSPDPLFFREVFRIGWPIGVSHGTESGLIATTAFLMGLLGTSVLAAHQIALHCAAFTFMVPWGISLATAVRVGQAAGRQDPIGVRQAGFVGIGLGAAVMTAAALCFWLLPRPIISIFLDFSQPANRPVVELAVALLHIAGFFQVFDGIQVNASGALRGLKDTRRPMLAGLVSYWLLGLGSGLILAFGLNWQAVGLWWGLVIGLAAAAVWLTGRFHLKSRELWKLSRAG